MLIAFYINIINVSITTFSKYTKPRLPLSRRKPSECYSSPRPTMSSFDFEFFPHLSFTFHVIRPSRRTYSDTSRKTFPFSAEEDATL